MTVKLHRRARADLREIRDYVTKAADPNVAEHVRLHLLTRILRLGQHPKLGVASSDPAIRVLSPSKYPYRIYFTVLADSIVILHIRHTARRLPNLDDLT